MNSDWYDEKLHIDLRDLKELKKIVPAVDTLINAIKSTDNYDDHLTAVSSFYDFAYRRGYDDGVKDNKNKEEKKC